MPADPATTATRASVTMFGMRLDHLSYAAGPEGLAACVQRLGSRLGAGFRDGGIHPSFGTRNFVLPLTDGCYLEVVEALDHPAAERAPFGRAVRARTDSGGGWLAWAVAVDDITVIETRLGRASVPGHRRRPDGFDLLWSQIGVNDAAGDPQLPFFTQWRTDAAHHPSQDGPASVGLVGLEISGDEQTVDAYLGESSRQPLDGIDVEWFSPFESEPFASEHGVIAALFATPRGEVRID